VNACRSGRGERHATNSAGGRLHPRRPLHPALRRSRRQRYTRLWLDAL